MVNRYPANSHTFDYIYGKGDVNLLTDLEVLNDRNGVTPPQYEPGVFGGPP